MAIYIGNKELNEVYIGNKAVKEIYVGRSLVWSKPSGSSLILTLDTSAATQELFHYYIDIYVNGDYRDAVYFDVDLAEALGGSYYFTNNTAIFPNVSDGDVVTFELWHAAGDDPLIQVKYNGVDINNASITINGQTNATFVVTDAAPTLTISLDVSAMSTDEYLAYCMPFYVNGSYIDYIWFHSGAGDYYFDDNLQFVYSNLSNGDVVTFGSAEHAAGDTPTVQMLYEGEDISNASVYISGNTWITFEVVPAEETLITNEIYIPYSEITVIDNIRNIFSSDDSRYFDKVLTVTLTTNSGQYSYTQQYYQDDYDSQQPLIIVSNIGIPVSDIEHPDSGAKWTFSYFDAGLAEEISSTYPVSFIADGNNYIGYLE